MLSQRMVWGSAAQQLASPTLLIHRLRFGTCKYVRHRDRSRCEVGKVSKVDISTCQRRTACRKG